MANIEDSSWEYTAKAIGCLTVNSDVLIYDFLELELPPTIPYRHTVVHPQVPIGLIQGFYLDPAQDLLIIQDFDL